MIPTSQNARLRRKQAAEALTEAGFQTAEATLASMASRGGGPPYELYGRFPIYTWGTLLAWAESRLSAPRHSTSEGDTQGASSAPGAHFGVFNAGISQPVSGNPRAEPNQHAISQSTSS